MTATTQEWVTRWAKQALGESVDADAAALAVWPTVAPANAPLPLIVVRAVAVERNAGFAGSRPIREQFSLLHAARTDYRAKLIADAVERRIRRAGALIDSVEGNTDFTAGSPDEDTPSEDTYTHERTFIVRTMRRAVPADG